MANKQYIVNHNNVHPNTGGTFWSIWVCDTDAGKPSSGLNPGDLGITLDQDLFYIADSTTTWVRLPTSSAVGGPFLSYDDWTFEGETFFNNTVDFGGTVNLPADVLSSGTYTPTRSGEVNMASNVTMGVAQYMRVGNTVTVSGNVTADPTTAWTTTYFLMSVPINSAFTVTEQACGTGASWGVGVAAEIYAWSANTVGMLWITNADVASRVWSYSYTYRIL